MTSNFNDEPGGAESIFASWAARVEGGESPAFEALVREHPEQAEALGRLHSDWELFAPLLGRAVPGMLRDDSGIVLAPLSGSTGDETEAPSPELLQRLGIHAPNSGRYRFRAVIGHGGGGVVLKVWDTKLNRALAMKVVLGRGEARPDSATPRVDGSTLTRFVDEARIASQLNHPGIVPVHELGADEAGRAFFTMKLVQGEDLSVVFGHVRTGHGGWNETRALGVLLRACEAMAFAHEKRVVHRDLKPANIMVGRHGEVYVMDWGLARVLGEADHHDLRLKETSRASKSMVDSLRHNERDATPDSPLITIDGTVLGTPAYMAPEQARGELEHVGPRADVYAFGAMFYELLAGEPPFMPGRARISPHTILMRVLEGPPRPLAELAPRAPLELVAICERAMDRDPTKRYPDVRALAEDLRAYLERRVVAAYESGTWAETRKWIQRNHALAASLAATFLVLVAGLGTSLVLKQRADNSASRANEQTRIAEIARNDALNASNEAIASAKAANKARLEADANAQEVKQQSYYASIIGAQAARRINEPASVRRFLDAAPEELRNWEWNYLNAVSDTSLLTLKGHIGEVYMASFSPNGTRIVTASGDGTARVWDATSGKELTRLEGHLGGFQEARYSSDGMRIYAVTWDGSVIIWDAQNWNEIFKLEGHPDEINKAKVNSTGSRIITTCSAHSPRLWDAVSGVQLKDLGKFRGTTYDACFSSSGEYALTASYSRAQIWDATTGQASVILQGELDSGNNSWRFSPDGKHVVGAVQDFSLRVWETSTGKELYRLGPETVGMVWSAEFSPDSKRIVTGSLDRLQILDAANGKEILEIKRSETNTNWATFSPDGERILSHSVEGQPRLWDASNGNELAILEGHTGNTYFADFSPDGTRIATASSDGTARIWAQIPGNEFSLLEGHTELALSVSCDPERSRAVSTSRDFSARVWALTSGKEIVQLMGHNGEIEAAHFNTDGTRIFTIASDHTARVWDATSGKELFRLEGFSGNVSSASFNSDGTLIRIVSMDGRLRVWNANNGMEISNSISIDSSLNPTHSSSDAPGFLFASMDPIKWAFDGLKIEGLLSLNLPSEESIWAKYSPNGEQIAIYSAYDPVCLWNATSEKKTFCFDVPSVIMDVAFTPDGTRVITGSSDGVVRVWDATNGNELARLEDPTSQAIWAVCSDGDRILTALENGTIRIFDSIPLKERYSERKELEAAKPAAHSWLDAALATTSEWAELEVRLRSDAYLSPIVREAALQELSLRANGFVLEASRLERSLRAQFFLAEGVIAELEADTFIRGELRTEAIRVARVRLDDPREINEWVWEVVRAPNAAPEVYKRAAHAAQVAADLVPDDIQTLNTLGVALYRAGDWSSSLDTLSRSDQLSKGRVAADIAFLAMARYQLGNLADAKSELARLRELLTEVSDDQDRAFLVEAEVLIEGIRSGQATGGWRVGGNGQMFTPEQIARERVATELRSDLAKIVEVQGDLFNEPWLRHAKRNFALAEQAVKILVVDGEPNVSAIDEFRYGLSAFARALEMLPDWSPGNSGWDEVKGTPKPSSKQLTAMLNAINALQSKASQIPEFQSVEELQLTASTTPEQAAWYGARVLTLVDHMLYQGTLEQITGEGIGRTTSVMKPPMNKLGSALVTLGEVSARTQTAGELSDAFAGALRDVNQSLAETRTALDELIRIHPWARPRVELAEPLLDLLESNLKKLEASTGD